MDVRVLGLYGTRLMQQCVCDTHLLPWSCHVQVNTSKLDEYLPASAGKDDGVR